MVTIVKLIVTIQNGEIAILYGNIEINFMFQLNKRRDHDQINKWE